MAASVALARRLGPATETVLDALGGSPLVSPWQAADGGFATLGCLAEEWQQAVDAGLGDQDLTVVTRVLQQRGGP